MGRRSRKRGQTERSQDADGADSPRGESSAVNEHERRRAHLDEAPKPPWAPVPLTELCIFVGIVVVAVALIGGGPRGLLIGFGMALIVIATLELALREHLGGYRSHSLLIAACSAVIVSLPLALLTGISKQLLLAVAAVVFGLVAVALRTLFRSRSGGMSWRA
ncbi:MAG: hypothetical protein F2813_07480 [Actinobacteria bacterium]|uniref:Unannotated protein n=1 Tax=freshwater metagenome TaxID=449393 RepID=A0A6J6A1A4_9ZZZZ|nr:hypothetical protein [Actinomycetota bacterium]